jgi:hypothetical protein
MSATVVRLPRVRVKVGKKPARVYYLDERLGELRDVNNPHKRLDLHAVQFATLFGAATVEYLED